MANIYYKSIGIEPYDRGHNTPRSPLLNIVFLINIVNMNMVLLGELVYVLLALKNNIHFVEATMNLSYIGFVFVGDIKIWNMLNMRSSLTKLMRDLRQIYPSKVALQESFNVERFLRKFKWITFGFSFIHWVLIWSYNLYNMLTYLIYDYWLRQRVVPRALPYYSYVPWNWENHWSYYILYASQNFAGHTCMAGQQASDIWLCATVTQVIMHYQYQAKCISRYVTQRHDCDMEFLKDLVEYHQKILSISDTMNEVFGVSLLVNFISSSFVMCFLGFQMTVGASTDNLVMLLMFLLCSLVQVYMISNYAQDLIIASESIGHAVYNHDWHVADIRYKKALVLIIKRAQKPSIMKATTFLNISLGTMTDLMQLSYKFFALLRTMYSKE